VKSQTPKKVEGCDRLARVSDSKRLAATRRGGKTRDWRAVREWTGGKNAQSDGGRRGDSSIDLKFVQGRSAVGTVEGGSRARRCSLKGQGNEMGKGTQVLHRRGYVVITTGRN